MLLWALLFQSAFASTELIRPLPWEDYLIYSFVSLGLVLFAGVMSGLTVGMLGIDRMSLEVKLANGTPLEQQQARKLLPVLGKHHLLLVTLLMANSLAMETLPLMLDEMMGEILAVLISVTFVFIFGEVVPQALCTGPNQLGIAIRMLPLVKFVVILFFPISYPISKLLDCFLGHEETSHAYSKQDLKTLIGMYQETNRVSLQLGTEQIEMVQGAIDLEYQAVETHMQPIDDVISVKETDVTSPEWIEYIAETGYSRVPVFDAHRTRVTGLLKTMFLLGNKREVPLREARFKLLQPVHVNAKASILSVLDLLRSNGVHMAIVEDDHGQVQGIVTVEDILNQALQTGLTEVHQRSYLMRRLSTQLSRNRLVGRRTLSVRMDPSFPRGFDIPLD